MTKALDSMEQDLQAIRDYASSFSSNQSRYARIHGTTTNTIPSVSYDWDSLTEPWEARLERLLNEKVAAATKEITETFKDLQDQIDEIWETLKEEDE